MPTGYSQNPYSTWRGGGEGHVYINGRGLLGLYNNKIIFLKIGFVIVEKPFFKRSDFGNFSHDPTGVCFCCQIHPTACILWSRFQKHVPVHARMVHIEQES